MKFTQTTRNVDGQRDPQRKSAQHELYSISSFGSAEARVGSLGGSVGSPGGRVGSPGGRVGSPGGRVGSPGGRVGSARVFRYQYVGIPNAKCSHWGFRPTQGPNPKGLALQWNIGFSLFRTAEPHLNYKLPSDFKALPFVIFCNFETHYPST